MEEQPKIEKLNELLSNYLGCEKTVSDHETEKLTATGENYGSQMLALKVHVQNKEKIEILDAVAKIPPPGEFIRRMFNIPMTFRNEIDFYSIIVPELEEFLLERDLDGYLDCFPKLFGARFNLQPPKKEVDDDAVLILENLKVQGYEMIDRNIGFDFATTKIIIKALARYHAAALGLKILKPEVFQKKIRPLFPMYKVFELSEDVTSAVFERNKKIIEENESCKQYSQRVMDAFKSTLMVEKNSPELSTEPFATIIHTDAWVNNFMVLFKNDEPAACKIVDFQLGEYGSPARDLIFFIYTSVQMPVVEQHYEELVKLYHQTLVDDLVRFGCDPAPFSFENFTKEMELAAKNSEFLHCMIMLQPIYATKDSLKELDQYTEEDMASEVPAPPKHKEKAAFIVREFVKRKWI